MRVSGRCAAKPQSASQARRRGLAVGEVDIDRAFDGGERARQQRMRHIIVLRDQRADLRRRSPVAAEQKARDAAVPLRDQFGGRQPPAQPLQQCAAVGAEAAAS